MVVFQPHRYTRTRDLLAEFGTALSGADEVVLTDIYPAGEPPIAGVTVDSARRRRSAQRATVRFTSCRISRTCRGVWPASRSPAIWSLPSAPDRLARVGDRILTALASGDASGGATCQ